jgi:hypothetical protein
MFTLEKLPYLNIVSESVVVTEERDLALAQTDAGPRLMVLDRKFRGRWVEVRAECCNW